VGPSKEELIYFISEKFHVDPERIEENTDFTVDLGLNSLRAMDLLMDLEIRFNCRIPDHAIPRCSRVKDLLSILSSQGQA